jgi:hypothetical protein
MTFRNCEPGQAIMSVFALIGESPAVQNNIDFQLEARGKG